MYSVLKFDTLQCIGKDIFNHIKLHNKLIIINICGLSETSLFNNQSNSCMSKQFIPDS